MGIGQQNSITNVQKNLHCIFHKKKTAAAQEMHCKTNLTLSLCAMAKKVIHYTAKRDVDEIRTSVCI